MVKQLVGEYYVIPFSFFPKTHRTGPAGARRTHLPKVILGVKGQDTVGRQILQPNIPRFVIGRRKLVAAKIRGIQTRIIHLEFDRQAFPCHGNGLLFEIVTKTPITEHFKKGVMVNVLADVVQVVVFATGTDALLRVDGAVQFGHGQGGVTRAQKEWLVLIHAGVGEQQSGVVDGDAGRGCPKGVAMFLDKEIDKGVADLVHGPFLLGF